MRFNERDLIYVASLKSDREGRLNYRSPNAFREGYKERWFKLKGNLLFYFRLNGYGGVYEHEPVGVFVIENCRIQMEQNTDLPFAFSIVFLDDADKKHMFCGPTLQHCEQWVKLLSEASYEYWRAKLQSLQHRILQKQAEQQQPKQLYRQVNKNSNVNVSEANLLLL